MKAVLFCVCIGDSEISETLDTCLLCMHQGEIWQVLLQNKHDQSKDENNPGSLPSAELTTAYEVQLLSFAKVNESIIYVGEIRHYNPHHSIQ